MARRNRGVLWYVFVGSRGGETRMCIVQSIMKRPQNPRELAKRFRLDYSTIRHSLRVLEKNRVVWVPEQKYGAKYEITPEFLGMQDEFKELQKQQKCTRG